jgi:pimeloyl-ACP methyl ester carboxylesterase
MNSLVQLTQGLLEYRVVGEGPTVLVLNGGHTSCNTPFGHEQFFIEQGYRLILPSRPGYGNTPLTTGPTAEAFADTLVSFLNYLQLEQAIVVGISAAGPTALQLAGRHPHRVEKLILQNAVTGGKLSSLSTKLGAYLFFNPWIESWSWAAFRAFARMQPRQALKLMLGNLSCLNPAQVLSSMSQKQEEGALAFLLNLRSGRGFLNDYRHICGDLERISAPTLIIRSSYDGSIDQSHADYAVERIPNAQLFVSSAESHLLWYSSYNTAIEKKMAEFLADRAS